MVWRPFYFAQPDRRSEEPEPHLQAGPRPRSSAPTAARASADIGGGAHGDFHDVWIDPKNTEHVDRRRRRRPLVLATTAATAGGRPNNLPISQFYHVSVDMDRSVPRLRRPAGQQLVGRRLARIPAASPTRAGRTCTAATASGCSPIRPIPTTSTPSRRAATSAASIARRTSTRDIQPQAELQGRKLRFNWNTPIHVSPTQKGTLYIGAQFLFRSRDHGQTLGAHLARPDDQRSRRSRSRSSRAASPSTTPSAEMHTTIYAISESPKNAQRDLGRHRRRQRAGHARRRQDVDERRRQRHGPAEERVGVAGSRPSHFDAGTAYATFDRHTFGDMTPYVYKTDRLRQDVDALVAAGRAACAATRT